MRWRGEVSASFFSFERDRSTTRLAPFDPVHSRRTIAALLTLALALGVYLLAWPVSVDPAPWYPPKAPELEGIWKKNDGLRIDRIPIGGIGPEQVTVGPDGLLYTGLDDARIVRLRPDGTAWEVLASTGGRPQTIAFGEGGRLIVADIERGLLAVEPDGTVTVLVDQVDGVPCRFVNDLAVASDGVVYFTESSSKVTPHELTNDLLEHRAYGRVLAYDPKSQSTRVVRDGLFFANGIALTPDESALLVAETSMYRVRRIQLTGPLAGEVDVLIDNLPGFPDNVRCGARGVCWIALVTVRNGLLDSMGPHPWRRKLLARLPRWMLPGWKRSAFVVGVKLDGTVVANLQADGERFGFISGVLEHEDKLYLGSLREAAIGSFQLATVPTLSTDRTEEPVMPVQPVE